MRKSKNLKLNTHLFSSISFKLSGSFCLLIGFIVIVGVSAYTSASNAIKANYKTSTMQALDMLGEYLEFGFGTASGAAVEYLVDETITEYLSGGMSDKQAEQTKYYNSKKSELTTKVTADTFLQSVYFFSDTTSSISTNKKSTLNMFSDYTQSEQGKALLSDAQQYYWYGKPSVIDEVLNIDNDSYAIRMVKAFYRQNSFLAMDIDKQAVLDVLNKLNLGEKCRVVFLSGDGRELHQDGNSEALIYGTDFYQAALAGELSAGYMENVEMDGAGQLFLYRKISDTGAMVCALIPHTEITKQVAGIKYLTMLVILIAVVLALGVGSGICISINRAIRYFVNKMECLANGDVSIRLHTKRKDELGTLAIHMNHMLESMDSLMGNAKGVSLKVADSAKRVANSSEILSESSFHISGSINQIEAGLSRQAKDAEDGVVILDSLANQIGIVNHETLEMIGITDLTNESLQDSFVKIQALKDKAEEASIITQEVITSIKELNLKSNLIEGIVDTIDAISQETTLLSLNAAIEAARAGAAGKGFAIVADSIKKLAEQSLNAANQIRHIVSEINHGTLQTVAVANNAGEVMELQGKAMIGVGEAFALMTGQVQTLVQKVEAIVSSIEKMQSEKEKSVKIMDSISGVTKESAMTAGTVNGKTRNQVQVVEEMETLSESMLLQVRQLETALERFSTK